VLDSIKPAIIDGTAGMITEVRRDKYMLPGEASWTDTLNRFARAVIPEGGPSCNKLMRLLDHGQIQPAGRPLAGMGSGRNVTAINCFVMNVIEDSMRSDRGIGIMDSLSRSAYTMQMGGGIGMCFSDIRPKGAAVFRVSAEASGPLSFMDMWDAMCRTIMSAGYRRGAMMATLHCDHPDVWNPRHFEVGKDGKLVEPSFISAKRDTGRLRMFNLSVMITDAFMAALEAGASWELGHFVPPFDKQSLLAERVRDGRPWYVYRRVPARQLWNDLLKATYTEAEPGVLFIDRANKLSNLNYCETVFACNPCAEQFLPPNGDCNLGHVNLAQCVIDPFLETANISYSQLGEAVELLVEVLDNTIDLSLYPLTEQKEEAIAKRRIGLGITGLGNALEFCRIRYGSEDGIESTRAIMRNIANQAYLASAMLAKDRGSFPLFDRDKFLKAPFVRKLDEEVLDAIATYGIRNGMLLTVAPTGTSSIVQGDNCSGGIEPTFEHYYDRDVLQPDGTFKTFRVSDHAYRRFVEKFGADAPLPSYMVTANELTAEEHVRMLGAAQEWVDNSISKTVNCPATMTFEEFKGVYDLAYKVGCKACATYRPDPTSTRGSVLKAIVAAPIILPPVPDDLVRRPDELDGRTYKLRWPHLEEAIYLTVNDVDTAEGKRPFEVFLSTKSVRHAEWMTIFTRLVSAVFRRGGDMTFLLDEMRQVQSAEGGAWIGNHHVPSLVAHIGAKLGEHFRRIGLVTDEGIMRAKEPCPRCGERAYVITEGCGTCTSCHYSNCG